MDDPVARCFRFTEIEHDRIVAPRPVGPILRWCKRLITEIIVQTGDLPATILP
jgi:hypothetical protein